MCRIRESFGPGVVGYLLGALAVVAVVTLAVLAGNAGIMLWRDARIVNLWGESQWDIGLAVMLAVPLIPGCGVYATRRRRCRL